MGLSVGVKSIWNDDNSITWNLSGEGGTRVRIARPILPPICASFPAVVRMCATSAVVVDLPLVPLIPIHGACGYLAARSRAKISTSPIISMLAALARSTVQCGSGCVSGTPGASTREENCDQSALDKSTMGTPAAAAPLRASSLSSQAATFAPPANSDATAAAPDAPSPNTAMVLPANVVARIIGENLTQNAAFGWQLTAVSAWRGRSAPE